MAYAGLRSEPLSGYGASTRHGPRAARAMPTGSTTGSSPWTWDPRLSLALIPWRGTLYRALHPPLRDRAPDGRWAARTEAASTERARRALSPACARPDLPARGGAERASSSRPCSSLARRRPPDDQGGCRGRLAGRAVLVGTGLVATPRATRPGDRAVATAPPRTCRPRRPTAPRAELRPRRGAARARPRPLGPVAARSRHRSRGPPPPPRRMRRRPSQTASTTSGVSAGREPGLVHRVRERPEQVEREAHRVVAHRHHRQPLDRVLEPEREVGAAVHAGQQRLVLGAPLHVHAGPQQVAGPDRPRRPSPRAARASRRRSASPGRTGGP